MTTTGGALARKPSLKLVGTPVYDRLLQPIHRWVWSDPYRRAKKLLGFALTEADSGRDMARAAECTKDGLLRRLYIRHALDEQKHSKMFTRRGSALLAGLPKGHKGGSFEGGWFSPGEHGLDDLDVDKQSDASLLAFLYLSERAGARRFIVYRDVLESDPETRDIFGIVMPDEAFHTNYTYAQLRRVAPDGYVWKLAWARLTILWKAYLRLAAAIASVMGAVVLTAQYFLVLPIFALMAKRAAKREPEGWAELKPVAQGSLRSQY